MYVLLYKNVSGVCQEEHKTNTENSVVLMCGWKNERQAQE